MSHSSLILGKTNPLYSYHIQGTTLPAPLLAPHLGIIVDSNLSLFLPTIISAIVSKARSRCAVFLKSFISLDPKTMLKFFTTYVRPIGLLEFSSSVWSPISSSDINKLENVQKYITNKMQSGRFRSYHFRLKIIYTLHLQPSTQVVN